MVALISSAGSTTAALFGAYFAYRASVHTKATMVATKQTEQNTNHLKDELVAAVKQVAFRKGVDQGHHDAERPD